MPLRTLRATDVEEIKDHLRDEPGRIVTTALGPMEQTAFREAGFVSRESLYLLRHRFDDHRDLDGPALIRRARRSDTATVLDIDGRCFDRFWSFDKDALNSARRATPTSRFVVAVIDGAVVGYAITGRAGNTGFLQRLGVSPDHRKRGLGSQLVNDALHWAYGNGASSMLVNTQEINTAALRLYESLGFVLDDDRLTVLEWQR